MAEWEEFEVELRQRFTRSHLNRGFIAEVDPPENSVVRTWCITWMMLRREPNRHGCKIAFHTRDPFRKNFVMWLNYVVTITPINGIPIFHMENVARTYSTNTEIIVSTSLINTKDARSGRFKVYFKADFFILDIKTPPKVPLPVFHHDCYFIEDFAPLFNNPEISDIQIIVGNTKFNAHKAILGAKSPVFHAMFKHNMAENLNHRIKIKHIRRLVFSLLLRFIYEGYVQIPNFAAAAELLRAANFYDIKDLKELCQKYIADRIDDDNVADVILFSELNIAPELRKMAMHYLCHHSHKFDIGKFEATKRQSLHTFSELLEMLSRNIVVQKKILPGFYTYSRRYT